MISSSPAQLKSKKDRKKLFARRGAPIGNTNRLKHGGYAHEMKQLRADVRDHLKRVRAQLDAIGARSKNVSK
jgi:hypothetical protein